MRLSLTCNTMKLIIPKEVEERIHGYVMSVESEIAGMGKVRIEGDTMIVEEVMIYEQEVTGATADLSPKAMAKWQSDLVRAGGSPKMWRLWWHSHANMAAFFSGTDTGTMDAQTESDWVMSLVVNKRRERKARLDLYRPFRMFLADVEIEIQGEEYTVPVDIAEEVKLKVKQSTPVYSGAGYRRGYSQPDDDDVPYNVPYGIERTKEELISMTATLQGQIADLDNKGQGDSMEANELTGELIELYYDLATKEASPILSDAILAKAEKLESTLYKLDPAETGITL